MQTITLPPPKRSWFSLFSWAILLAVLVISGRARRWIRCCCLKTPVTWPPSLPTSSRPILASGRTISAKWLSPCKSPSGDRPAVILSIPFGLMSAGNIVPWWIYQPMRRLMDACRAINEMVFAMLFVVAVGLGPFAG